MTDTAKPDGTPAELDWSIAPRAYREAYEAALARAERAERAKKSADGHASALQRRLNELEAARADDVDGETT